MRDYASKNVESYKLPANIASVLKRAGDYLRVMRSLGKPVSAIHLFAEDYRQLEKFIERATLGQRSVRDLEFRGLPIRSHE